MQQNSIKATESAVGRSSDMQRLMRAFFFNTPNWLLEVSHVVCNIQNERFVHLNIRELVLKFLRFVLTANIGPL